MGSVLSLVLAGMAFIGLGVSIIVVMKMGSDAESRSGDFSREKTPEARVIGDSSGAAMVSSRDSVSRPKPDAATATSDDPHLGSDDAFVAGDGLRSTSFPDPDSRLNPISPLFYEDELSAGSFPDGLGNSIGREHLVGGIDDGGGGDDFGGITDEGIGGIDDGPSFGGGLDDSPSGGIGGSI